MNRYFIWIKVVMIDIKFRKIAAEVVPVNILGLVMEIAEISIQEMVIDIIETCHTEVATID